MWISGVAMRTPDCKGKASSNEAACRAESRTSIGRDENSAAARKSESCHLQSTVMNAAQSPKAFIRQLPKAELHLHLEGAVEPATLFELRKQHGEQTTLEETSALYGYTDFPSFLIAFKEVSEIGRAS